MKLDHAKQEAIIKISNIGFSKAGTALSTLLQKNITLRVPEVKTASFKSIFSIVDNPNSVHVVVFLRVEGDAPGKIALFLPIESAQYIVQILFASDNKSNIFEDAMAQSALMEVGNIVVSSFLSALGDNSGLTMLPSTPAVAIDMAGALIQAILIEDGILDDDVLLLRTIIEGSSAVQGQLVFFPNTGSLTKLLGALS